MKPAPEVVLRHSRVVRITHWVNTVSFFALVVSGAAILIAHPRFYWGETGYFDTPAVIALPLSVNLRHTAWGRSLHFLAAWIAVLNGVVYVISGLLTRHFLRRLLPARAQIKPPAIRQILRDHARLKLPKGEAARQYNPLQKLAYLTVVFGLLPLAILTGLTMSPGVTAAYPALLTLFGGHQSARTIHFIVSILLVLFLVGHVAMVMLTGFVNQMRAMITGRYALTMLNEPIRFEKEEQ
jgi:thiosulfate reductase cytochrome b subunit